MASAFNPRSVIADVNVEAPDFGMLAKAAVSVQNRYLEGFNRYKSTITSLLNAQVSSDDNIKFRTDYFKKIDGYLNNLGGVDFSNPANVSVASDLMQPLVKDPEFVADLNFNMLQGAEKQKLEQVKLSTDEKVRMQYSADLEAAMNYNFIDMKNAKRGDGSIMKIGVQKYLPFANLQKVLDDGAKALELNISPDPIITDKWIIKDKFGNNAIPDLTHWARQQLGTNYDEQILVTNKVNVRRQLDNLMGGNPNLTKEEAYQQIAKDNSLGIYKNFEDYKNSLDSSVVSIDKQIADIKSRLNNKIAKDSPEAQLISQLKKLKSEYQRELADSNTSARTKDEELQTAFNQFLQNPEYALLPVFKDNLAKQWATSYARTHADREIKSNPYGEIAVRFANEKELKKMDQAFDLMMEEIKHMNAVDLKLMESGIGVASSTAPGVINQVDPFVKFTNESKANLEMSYDGYFDKSVLEVATSSLNLANDIAPYNVLRNSLETYVNMYPVHKNNYTANREYSQAAATVINLVRAISPGFTKEEAAKLTPGTLMKVIASGVNTRYAGNKNPNDPMGQKYLEAKTKLFNAQTAWEGYGDRKYDLIQRFAGMTEEERKQFDNNAWETSGLLIPRGDADPKVLKNAYTKLFPNWKEGQTETVTGYQTPKVDEDKFDYSAIAEAIGASEQAADGSIDPPSFDKSNSNLSQTMRAQYQSGGIDLKQYFAPQMSMYPITIGGKEYMKVVLGTKTNTDGEVRNSSTGSVKGSVGLNQGSVSLYIERSKAEGLWQSMAEVKTRYGNKSYYRYGDIAEIPGKLFRQQNPVRWVKDGLERSQMAYFPSSLKTAYDLDGGYVAFGGKQSSAPVMVVVQIDGKQYDEEIKLPDGNKLTRSVYQSDPGKFSRDIDKIVRITFEKILQQRQSKIVGDANLHNSNYLQNSGNFTTVDAIPAA